MIKDGGRAGVDGLQAPGQLGPEDVLGLIVGTLEDALDDVVGEQVVPMASSQADGVHVAVGVDEAWGHDLVDAVDDLDVDAGVLRVDSFSDDLDDCVALDEQIGLDAGGAVVGIVGDDHTALEQQRRSRHGYKSMIPVLPKPLNVGRDKLG
jgi:hypothetical protein